MENGEWRIEMKWNNQSCERADVAIHTTQHKTWHQIKQSIWKLKQNYITIFS